MSGTTTSGMDAAAEATTEATTPTESIPAIPQKIKVKVDGQENEVDLDEITRDYQKYKSSDKRYQEAAEMRRQVDTLLSRAQQGDLSWLKGLVSQEQIRKFAESELLEHIEWESKPEIEREAISAKREAERLRKEIEEITQTREREEASKIEEKAYQEIEADIVDAIKDLGMNFKVTPLFIRRIAEQMHAQLVASNDPHARPTAKLAASRALKGVEADVREMLQVLPLEQVLEMLPPSLRKAMRQQDVNLARSQAPFMGARQTKGTSGVKKPVRTTTDDFFSKIEKKFR